MAAFETLFERRRRRNRFNLKKRANGRPLLSIHRTNKHIIAQIIDGETTLAYASTLDKDLQGKLKSTSNKDAAKAVGDLIAKRAKAAKIEDVVFDRGGFPFHGRVKALADAARAGGLNF